LQQLLYDIALCTHRVIHWNRTSAWRVRKRKRVSSETRVMRIRISGFRQEDVDIKKEVRLTIIASGCCVDRDTKDTPGVRGRGTTHSASPRTVSGSSLLRDTFYAGITRRNFNPRRCLLHNSARFFLI